MNESLPQSPFKNPDHDILRKYIERQNKLESLRTELRARSFGRRVFQSTELRLAINDLAKLQSAMREHYYGVINSENIETYNEWYEDLIDAIVHGSGNDTAADTFIGPVEHD